jgi:hypothetical protein
MFRLSYLFAEDETDNSYANIKVYQIGKYWNSASSVTVVTHYFPLWRSKHPKKDYQKWLRNMLLSIGSTPLVIYTDPVTSKYVRRVRSELDQGETTYLIYENVWSLMRELEVIRNRSYINNYKNRQNKLDPERRTHSPNLYALWNIKPYMVKKIASANPYNSSFFIYTDAGAWRTKVIQQWPDLELCNKLEKKLNNRVLLGQIESTFNLSVYSSHSSFIQGTFFAGSQSAVLRYATQFYDLHDKLIDKGKFIGKDQTQMRVMAMEMYTQSIARLRAWQDNKTLKYCPTYDYDSWFFYQLFFSPGTEHLRCNQTDRLNAFLIN